jgi:HAD superfamily hydrolase (TIGR01490 family)
MRRVCVNSACKIHIFDVDYTLVKKATSYYFLREGLRKKLVRWGQIKQLPFEYVRYKLGFANHGFIENAVSRLAGIEKEKLDALAEYCFSRFIRPNLYTGAVDLIRRLKDSGAIIVLATSSPRFIILPLQNFVGAEDAIASDLELIDGKTSGRLDGKSVFGKNKLEAARSWLSERNIDAADVWFYSDSYTDIPLLEYCAHPAAINPDPILRKKAVKNGWKIICFKDTVG